MYVTRPTNAISFTLLSPTALPVVCVLDSTPCLLPAVSNILDRGAVSRRDAATTRSTAAAATGTPPPPLGRASSAKSFRSSITGKRLDGRKTKECSLEQKSGENDPTM